MIKNIVNIFFELLQVSIGTRICLSQTPSETEWGKLYEMSKKQSLVGVCFAGVQRLQQQRQGPPKMLYLTWMFMAAKISQNYDNMRSLEKKLDALFKERGVKVVLVKGASIAAHYDEPKLRQFGDIDIYSPYDYEVVNEILKSIATEFNEDYYRHSEAWVDNVMVENHKYLTDIRGQKRWLKFEKYLTSLTSAELASVGNGGIYHSEDMLTLLFFVYHAQAHFLFDKITMKFLVDWCVLIQSIQIPEKVIVERLQEYGLIRFAAMLTRISAEWLGLQVDSIYPEINVISSSFDNDETKRFKDDFFCYTHVGLSTNSFKDRMARAQEFYRNRWKLKDYLGVSATQFVWEKFYSICKNKFNNKY